MTGGDDDNVRSPYLYYHGIHDNEIYVLVFMISVVAVAENIVLGSHIPQAFDALPRSRRGCRRMWITR